MFIPKAFSFSNWTILPHLWIENNSSTYLSKYLHQLPSFQRTEQVCVSLTFEVYHWLRFKLLSSGLNRGLLAIEINFLYSILAKPLQFPHFNSVDHMYISLITFHLPQQFSTIPTFQCTGMTPLSFSSFADICLVNHPDFSANIFLSCGILAEWVSALLPLNHLQLLFSHFRLNFFSQQTYLIRIFTFIKLALPKD